MVLEGAVCVAPIVGTEAACEKAGLPQGCRVGYRRLAQTPLERDGRACRPRVVSIFWNAPRNDVFRSDEEVITSGNGIEALGCRGVAVVLVKGQIGGSHRGGAKPVA